MKAGMICGRPILKSPGMVEAMVSIVVTRFDSKPHLHAIDGPCGKAGPSSTYDEPSLSPTPPRERAYPRLFGQYLRTRPSNFFFQGIGWLVNNPEDYPVMQPR